MPESIEPQATNPCTEIGCHGACCTDMVYTYLSEQDFLRMIQDQTYQIISETEFRCLEDYRASDPRVADVLFRNRKPPGIYYCKENSSAIFHRRRCPSLEQNGDCGIYDKRPQQCADFQFDSAACQASRRTTDGNVIALHDIPIGALIEA